MEEDLALHRIRFYIAPARHLMWTENARRMKKLLKIGRLRLIIVRRVIWSVSGLLQDTVRIT
jgi:hypothetical protein